MPDAAVGRHMADIVGPSHRSRVLIRNLALQAALTLLVGGLAAGAVYNAAENLAGTYFIPALRDGMATRGIDASADRVEIKLDVTFGAGPSNVLIRGRRIIPQGLSVAPAKAA